MSITYQYEIARLRHSDAAATASSSLVQHEATLAFRVRVGGSATCTWDWDAGNELWVNTIPCPDGCTCSSGPPPTPAPGDPTSLNFPCDNCEDLCDDGSYAPATVYVTAAEVLATHPGRANSSSVTEDDIPEVGMDILFANGAVYPFMHCGSAQVKQNEKATQEFIFTTIFRTGQFNHVEIRDLGPIAVPANLNAYPVIYQTEQRLVDFVLYEDNSTTPKQCKLPTGNLYSQPFIEKVPNETKIVTQYEATFSDELVAERLERVNSASWITTGDANKWKITAINWQEVRIVVGTGSNPVALDCFLVEYTVQKLDKPAGWRSKRALLDTHYLATAGDESTRMPFVTKEGGRTNYIGQIDVNGIPAPGQIQYEEFVVQEEIDFAFLRAESP